MMKRYTYIKDPNGLQRAVVRDLNAFPDTDAGDAALLVAINAGQIPIVDRPVGDALIGQVRMPLVDNRTDFLGRPIKTSVAPTLFSATRLAPRPTGNDYPFEPQTALNAIKHERVPKFTNHPRKVIIYPGGLYLTMADNDLIGRGWTHVSESPKWNGNYPPFRRATETAFYEAAYYRALTLPDSDPRKAKLLAWSSTPQLQFEGAHELIDDEATMRLYAQAWLDTLSQPDWNGAGVDYVSVNHEVNNGPYSKFIVHSGLLTRAIIEEAATRGQSIKSGLTDFANLVTYQPYLFDQPASGTFDNGTPIPDPDGSVPRYMHFSTIEEPYRGSSRSAPLGEVSILATLVKQGRAFAGVGSYLQHTWDEESFFQKNVDGSYKVDGNGNPLWRTDERTATICGQSVTLYNGDAKMGMFKWYGIYARYAAHLFFQSGGKHLPLSTDRQTGWEQMAGLIRQFRLDGEVESGLPRSDAHEINQRALNADQVESDAIRMYLFADYLRGWMNSQAPTAFGADRGVSSQARASAELMEKGFHRAAQLNWIHDTPWQLVQPRFWVFKQGINGTEDPEEHFARKPYLQGGLATHNGKPVIWLVGEWACQDVDESTDVLVWIDKGAGPVSPAYRIQLTGRRLFLDDWTLPDDCAGAEPKHIYFQFTDLIGVKRTWRGDYREARVTVHPMPPAVREVGNGPASAAFIQKIQRRYNGANLYYDIQAVGGVPQCRTKINGQYVAWTDAESFGAGQGSGYTHFYYANLGGPGTVTEVQVRLLASDTPIDLYYVLPTAGQTDDGTEVYPLTEDAGQWEPVGNYQPLTN